MHTSGDSFFFFQQQLPEGTMGELNPTPESCDPSNVGIWPHATHRWPPSQEVLARK